MIKSILSINQLTFSYCNQEKNLFTNLNCSFPSGWTGVVGANGSGKSTLLKLLSRALKPNSGNIISPGLPV